MRAKIFKTCGGSGADAETATPTTPGRYRHMTVHATLAAITIDCASPDAMAQFYREVTGWKITHLDNDSAYLGEGPIQLAFQRVEDYKGPG
jgi:hypothetical protein